MSRRMSCAAVVIAVAMILPGVLMAGPAQPGPEPAAPRQAEHAVTVGDFVVRLADTLEPSGRPVTSLDAARSFFLAQGIVIPAGLDTAAPLRQIDVSVIASLIGLDVTVPNPGERFDAIAVEAFVGFLRWELGSGRLEAAGNGDLPLHLLAATSSGACCEGAACSQTTPGQCPGSFKGQGIPCDPDPCVEGKGVCCEQGECSFTLPEDCEGRFRGLSSCTPGTCQGRKGRVPVSPTQP